VAKKRGPEIKEIEKADSENVHGPLSGPSLPSRNEHLLPTTTGRDGMRRGPLEMKCISPLFSPERDPEQMWSK